MEFAEVGNACAPLLSDNEKASSLIRDAVEESSSGDLITLAGYAANAGYDKLASSLNLRPLSKRYHVSQWVIARRASEINLISSDQYWSFVKKLMDEKRRYSSKGGPNPHVMRTQRVSRRVARAVVSEALCGKLLLRVRDAWRLIEIKPNKRRSYAESLQL